MTYQEAFVQGLVKEGDYFRVDYPDGRIKLFRLVKNWNNKLIWLGPPTDQTLSLVTGRQCDLFIPMADAIVKDEYDFPEVFENVHPCRLLDKEDFEFHSVQEYYEAIEKVQKVYSHFDDVFLRYILATRVINLTSSFKKLYICEVYHGGITASNVCLMSVNAYAYGGSFRPEATPKPTLRLQLEDCDGSKKKPWICLINKKVAKDSMASSKEGFRRLITEWEDLGKEDDLESIEEDLDPHAIKEKILEVLEELGL